MHCSSIGMTASITSDEYAALGKAQMAAVERAELCRRVLSKPSSVGVPLNVGMLTLSRGRRDSRFMGIYQEQYWNSVSVDHVARRER